jgi:hypothetical protein
MFFFSSVFDSDNYEALGVRLSGFCTIDLIKTQLNSAHELSEDIAHLIT